jgi:hypothetical protein
LRGLRIAEPTQLCLRWDNEECLGERWERLPEATRVAVLALLARLIARGVLAEDGGDG